MRKAHGVALMCHSLWQAVEAGRRREGFVVNGLLYFIVSALEVLFRICLKIGSTNLLGHATILQLHKFLIVQLILEL